MFPLTRVPFRVPIFDPQPFLAPLLCARLVHTCVIMAVTFPLPTLFGQCEPFELGGVVNTGIDALSGWSPFGFPKHTNHVGKPTPQWLAKDRPNSAPAKNLRADWGILVCCLW